ncbi:hypothetical protein Xmir_02982 [Xenorhabdus miraniensis]|uniref:Uncharacterized protein n=1 Tax=Xenorhabdus miraniensis TaxID=351674 RepID=A0A2D0JMW3_9GAMM|nr:hypothetical protein Xmir_02982 [Xenorhabdus miraniensis]
MKAAEIERHHLATDHFAVVVELRSEALIRVCEKLSIELLIE